MWQWEKVQTQVQNLKKQLFVLWLSISILTSIISRSVLYFNMPFWIYLPSLLSSMYFYFGFDLTVLIVLWHIDGFTVCACKTLKHFNLNIKTFIDVLLFCFFLQHLQNAAVLILANKQDIKGSMTAAEISQCLTLDSITTHSWHVQACCALTGEGWAQRTSHSLFSVCHRYVRHSTQQGKLNSGIIPLSFLIFSPLHISLPASLDWMKSRVVAN